MGLANDANAVIQAIEHAEPPAYILPEEAAQTADELWATNVEVAFERSPNEFVQSSRETVLLTFSRASEPLDVALLASGAAQAAIAIGVDVKPQWAHGAKIFVNSHVEAPFMDPMAMHGGHVLVYKDEVDDLLTDLKHLPYTIRKLKPTASRRVFPEHLSLLEVSSGNSVAPGASISLRTGGRTCSSDGFVEACAQFDEAEFDTQQVFPVRNTFIHYHLDLSQEARSTRSAPL